MQNTKVCHSERQLSVTPFSMSKHDAVSWTVHWLQSPRLLLYLKFEHIILVMLPMTRCPPEVDVVHVGRLHFLIASFLIFRPHQFLQGIEDKCATRQDKGVTRG